MIESVSKFGLQRLYKEVRVTIVSTRPKSEDLLQNLTRIELKWFK